MPLRLKAAMARIIPAETHWTVSTAISFYLAHLLCEGWIGTSQGFLAISLIAAIVALRLRRLRLSFHPLYLPLGLFLIASTISAALSFRPAVSVPEVSEWFIFLTFPLGVTLYRNAPRTLRAAILCLLILGLLQSFYGLGQYYILGRRILDNRISGTAAHVMTYSGLLLPVSLLSIRLAFESRRVLAIVTALSTSLALLLTFTRSAWIGWLAGVITILVVRRSRWLAYSVPVLILAITFSPLPLFGRFMSSFDLKQSSNLDRIRMAQAGVEIIKDQPFFGVGPGNVKEIYPLYREPDAPRFRIPHLHNNAIQIWAERGLLALAAYFLLIGGFVWLCWREGERARGREGEREKRFFAEVGLAVAVALFSAGFFEFNFGDSEVVVLMLDVFALVCVGLELPQIKPGNDPAPGTVVP